VLDTLFILKLILLASRNSVGDIYYGARLLFGARNVLDTPTVRRAVNIELLHQLCD
jgi:hypothetical protein